MAKRAFTEVAVLIHVVRPISYLVSHMSELHFRLNFDHLKPGAVLKEHLKWRM